MAAKHFLREIAGIATRIFGVQTSAGSANGGDIVALRDDGLLDPSLNVPEVNTYTHVTDFLTWSNTQQPWLATAINGGSSIYPASGVINPEHPGVLIFRSAAAANSGYRIMTDVGSQLLGGKEKTTAVFCVTGAVSTSVNRFGFMSATGVGIPGNGAYIEFTGAGVLTANCTTASSITSVNLATLDLNTWYSCKIEVLANLTVRFTVYNPNGTIFDQTTISTNVPTAAGRYVGHGVMSFNVPTGASDCCRWDYMDLTFTALVRS